ncbi:hypothetical protein BJ878DRAFT_226327 [Calycina marina]|uniref:LYR motif-containing protein Cup1-like N-terminal domain-containing protein n=1 Tax=Calycina marina TaxID=1763456 RepID=A0A9P7Z7K4_9HELO|nr:hypothetical protein BJ878DRAFT_226327 [Calycina marina]
MNPFLTVDLRLPSELRHAYRSLLRAATYLPDSHARDYFHAFITTSFRKPSEKIATKLRHQEDPEPLLARYHSREYISSLHRKAKKLHRASLGSVVDLEDALMRAYGRSGARRRQLLAAFMKTKDEDIVPDSSPLQDMIRATRSTDMHEKPVTQVGLLQYGPNSSFTALKTSHEATHYDRRIARAAIVEKWLYAGQPQKTMWGRPMPLKRHVNDRKRNFRRHLELMHAPLPVAEWTRLQGFATGAIPIPVFPERRKRVGEEVLEGTERSRRLLEYFTTPVDISQPQHNLVTLSSQGLVAHDLPTSTMFRLEKHDITPRFLRRLYAKMWYKSPKLTRDPESEKWLVTWGAPAASCDRITEAGQGDEELFEGLDDLEVGMNKKKRRKRGWKGKADARRIEVAENKMQQVGRDEVQGYLRGVVPALISLDA